MKEQLEDVVADGSVKIADKRSQQQDGANGEGDAGYLADLGLGCLRVGFWQLAFLTQQLRLFLELHRTDG